MPVKLNRILIYPAEFNNKRLAAVVAVCGFFSAHGVEVFVFDPDAAYAEAGGCGRFADESEFLGIDLVVAVGGDGTMLLAAKAACVLGVPVLGVNCGRLGYLSALEIGEIDLLSAVIDGSAVIENRMLLSLEHLSGSGAVLGSYLALNDVVLGSDCLSKAVELRVICDGREVFDVTGDGVIIGTSTGSTGYSFSAGGPVIDPKVNCITVTPICPHSFVSRSVVLSEDSVVSVFAKRGNVCFAFDGGTDVKIDVDEAVKIRKSSVFAQFVQVKSQNFYSLLSKKLADR